MVLEKLKKKKKKIETPQDLLCKFKQFLRYHTEHPMLFSMTSNTDQYNRLDSMSCLVPVTVLHI